ncbi:hypothetical protein GH714_034757 [Hevea brasiliensis]|uniref:Uncharacterized protein n=1 Tax=Hevea brasiliensis TaxID=3981 RepID=A0A6A6KF01_HEVBR|nr:hypothetical protein GH714_034757 [Hevea brasiliensis]
MAPRTLELEGVDLVWVEVVMETVAEVDFHMELEGVAMVAVENGSELAVVEMHTLQVEAVVSYKQVVVEVVTGMVVACNALVVAAMVEVVNTLYMVVVVVVLYKGVAMVVVANGREEANVGVEVGRVEVESCNSKELAVEGKIMEVEVVENLVEEVAGVAHKEATVKVVVEMRRR